MNWSRFPKWICKDIDSINRNLFWKDNCNSLTNNKELYTIAWDKTLGLKEKED